MLNWFLLGKFPHLNMFLFRSCWENWRKQRRVTLHYKQSVNSTEQYWLKRYFIFRLWLFYFLFFLTITHLCNSSCFSLFCPSGRNAETSTEKCGGGRAGVEVQNGVFKRRAEGGESILTERKIIICCALVKRIMALYWEPKLQDPFTLNSCSKDCYLKKNKKNVLWHQPEKPYCLKSNH